MRNSNQILHVDLAASEENFYMVNHTTCPDRKNFVTGMLMCDLFVVANLVVYIMLVVSLIYLVLLDWQLRYAFVVVH